MAEPRTQTLRDPKREVETLEDRLDLNRKQRWAVGATFGGIQLCWALLGAFNNFRSIGDRYWIMNSLVHFVIAIGGFSLVLGVVFLALHRKAGRLKRELAQAKYLLKIRAPADLDSGESGEPEPQVWVIEEKDL